MSKIVTIIGSRETPEDILDIMYDLILSLNNAGTTIRSGGAPGADHVVTKYAEKKEIIIPWDGFQDLRNTDEGVYLWNLSPNYKDATKIALEHYHSIGFAKQSHRSLHSRNAMQVLGLYLDKPASFVVCWTPGGNKLGGTATAIKIAEAHGVPVYNLGNPETLNWFKENFYGEN